MIKVGDEWFKKGELEDALKAYTLANYQEGLIKVKNELFKKANLGREEIKEKIARAFGL
ncbi:MAG: hypothetical protein QXL88_01575 [Candidatus Pacearchaeota archaeon]